jgi:hypothetical protein
MTLERNIKLCFVLCVLLSCNINNSSNSNKQKVLGGIDTVFYEYEATNHKVVLEKRDTSLLIDNEHFILAYSAKIEPSILFNYTDIYTENGSIHKVISKGFNASYTISLNNSLNQLVFSTTLNKNDFKRIIDNDLLARSDAELPRFIAYLNKFEAFLFTLDFWLPDSDVGGQCFFMLNKQGKLIESSTNNYYGGGDCDGVIEISSNKDLILTCTKLLNANGRKIDITDKQFWQVGTKLLNDDVILLIQEHNDTNNIINAKLINRYGKPLKSFTYKGYYEVLGYVVPMHFDSLSNNYFLMDEAQQNIRVISKNQPLETYVFAYDKMQPFNHDKRESELVFELNGLSNYTFAFDTLTNTFRYKRNE